MGHYYSNTNSGLTLEPMEISNPANGLFGDFSSRDIKGRGKISRGKNPDAEADSRPRHPAKKDAKKNPEDKAGFLRDDRKSPDRRRASRRNSIRLTGDRRQQCRRAKSDPWSKAFLD